MLVRSLITGYAAILLLFSGIVCAGETAMPALTTHVYKVIDGIPIKADVYRSDDLKQRPVLMWIHGGGLIIGNRGTLHPGFRDLALDAGFIVVAIDYRLAPEVKLPQIVEDVVDAYNWIREQGPALFAADSNRVVVGGDSAGGYLSLMLGHRADPKPRAVVSFWGYGDIAGDWYAKPSTYYRSEFPILSPDQAHKYIGLGVVTESPLDETRGAFYLYCRQQGLWIQKVTGRDPLTGSEWLHQFCPVRHVGPDFPPTILVHGQADNDVPHEQAVMMAEALEHAGVVHELISIPLANHGLRNIDPDVVLHTFERSIAFILRHGGPQ